MESGSANATALEWGDLVKYSDSVGGRDLYGIVEVPSVSASLVRLTGSSIRHQEWINNLNLTLIRKPSAELLAEVCKFKAAATFHYGSLSGTDPEIFVLGPRDKVIPAWEFLPDKSSVTGTRVKVPNYAVEEGSVEILSRAFWDGFQAEFTTQASSCHEGAISLIRQGLFTILYQALAHEPKAKLTHKCVVEIPPTMMKLASDEHAALGCAPSLNAYGPEEVLGGFDARALGIRFAGCHLHFNQVKKPETAIRIVKALDAIVGVVMVSLLAGLEDPRRRIYYGRAGEYRLPPHGLEWRVPSSAVLADPTITYLVFDLARRVKYFSMMWMHLHWKAEERETTEIINNLDVPGARRVIKRNEKVLASILGQIYSTPDPVMRLITEGACEVMLETDKPNLFKSWELGSYGNPSIRTVRSWATDCHRQVQAKAPVPAKSKGRTTCTSNTSIAF